MNEDINIIFTENIEYLIQLEKIIKDFRCQNFYRALQHFHKVVNGFTETINHIFKCKDFFNQQYSVIDEKMLVQMLENIMLAQENEDYVLLADLLELQLLPFLITIQNLIQQNGDDTVNLDFYKENYAILKMHSLSLCDELDNIEYPDLSIYQIENTSIGVKTLKINSKQNYYMHSNGNPYKEAGIFIDEHYDSNVRKYIFFGLGLGYHIYCLLSKNPINKIEVYEVDINIIRLALEYSDMTEFLRSKRLTINYDPELRNLIKRLGRNMDEAIFLLHQPSIRNIKNIELRQSMENFFVSYSSLKNQEEMLNTNFKENIKLQDSSVDKLREELEGSKLIIVAGGPSLDKNINILREYYNGVKERDYKIIAVGTVLKKILELDIIPDYVIMSDAQARVKEQINNIDTSLVPLIYLSTVAYEVPKSYIAKRYIVLQEDYQMAEKYSKEIGATLFKTGGSVVTTALDIGLRMKCASLIFLGLDLAYTNLKTHANNTMDMMTIGEDNLREVLSVNGEKIYTGKNLDSYRKWIERRIADESNIEIIDATEGGALIHGMVKKKISDILTQC